MPNEFNISPQFLLGAVKELYPSVPESEREAVVNRLYRYMFSYISSKLFVDEIQQNAFAKLVDVGKGLPEISGMMEEVLTAKFSSMEDSAVQRFRADALLEMSAELDRICTQLLQVNI